MKALYDYEANAPGELSVKEDEILLVFDTEDDWLLVQSQKEGGKAGFVPGNYVEVRGRLHFLTNRLTVSIPMNTGYHSRGRRSSACCACPSHHHTTICASLTTMMLEL